MATSPFNPLQLDDHLLAPWDHVHPHIHRHPLRSWGWSTSMWDSPAPHICYTGLWHRPWCSPHPRSLRLSQVCSTWRQVCPWPTSFLSRDSSWPLVSLNHFECWVLILAKNISHCSRINRCPCWLNQGLLSLLRVDMGSRKMVRIQRRSSASSAYLIEGDSYGIFGAAVVRTNNNWTRVNSCWSILPIYPQWHARIMSIWTPTVWYSSTAIDFQLQPHSLTPVSKIGYQRKCMADHVPMISPIHHAVINIYSYGNSMGYSMDIPWGIKWH